jgi:hypothetical protein
MVKRLTALIGLSILVVLAGCSGTTGPQSPTSTPSGSTPQSTTDQPANQFDGVELPNGTTAASINESAVLLAHQSLLASQDYRIGINLTHATSGRVANTTTVIASNRSQRQLHLQSDLPGRSLQEYYTANQSMSRREVGGDVTFNTDKIDSFESVHKREAGAGSLLTTVLTTAEFNAVNTTTVDGNQAVIYNVTDVSGANSTRLPSTIQQFNGTVIIGERGIIWEATLLTVGVQNERVEAMVQEYQTLEHGNIRVKKPEWVQNRTGR